MWADSPHTNHNTEGVEGYKVEIQQILSTLNAQNTSPDENVASESTDSVGSPTTSTAEGGTVLTLPRFGSPSQSRHSSHLAFNQTRLHSSRPLLLDRGRLFE